MIDLGSVSTWIAPHAVTVASAALIIAGSAVLRGFTGFGFALAAVPLLGFVLGPTPAVMTAIGLQFVGGLHEAVQVRQVAHWPSLRWLMAGAIVGSPFGTWALAALSVDAARVVIALVCLSAVVLIAAGRSFARHPTSRVTLGIGVLAGLFNGLAAMPGPPVIAYYMAMPMAAAVTRASLMTFFTATAAIALAAAFVAGLWSWQNSLVVAAGFPLMMLGTAAGQALFRRGSDHHRTASLVVLAAIAIVSGLQGLAALL
ncbi:sulfite exporter TauE/SafE family protein [Mangrovicella endophytica]|uniref:sulfite exporter TauE/SafE family protein n=1 Tax=Mangrovicella endophytica TaxID=2066697 RepID=UPI000C9EB485|nr:sulfite exporter TauE/SafE family protein [Mangrovicella endophytica]